MGFDLATAQPVAETPQGTAQSGTFDVQSTRPVKVIGGDNDPQTEYQKFQQSERDTVMMSQQAAGKVTPPESTGKDLKPQLEKQTEYPSHSFLNHPIKMIHSIIG